MFKVMKPERRLNIARNPSAEGPLGFSVVNGTAVRTDARAHWGRRSWLVTPSGAGCYLQIETDAAANSTHVLTCWASNGEPTEFRLGTGAARPWPVEHDGVWTRYEAVLSGSQVSGATAMRITVNRATYIDDVQVEAGSVRSSTFNGAMGFGYRWNGQRHYSTSERFRYFKRRLVATGGLEKVLDDDERVRVSVAYGVGVPPVRIRKAERETGDGEIHLDRSLEPRAIRLTLWLVEDDPDALFRLRGELIDLLAPKDEIMLSTDAWPIPQYIIGAYQSGLELGEVFYSNEKITLNIVCPDSGWTAIGQTAISLALSKSFTTTYTTIRQNGQWKDGGSPGGPVRRLIEAGDGSVYAATLSDGTYGWVAQQNGATWTKLARVSGGTAAVHDVARSFDGKKLYFTGSFTSVARPDGTGSVAAAHIAVLDLETNTLSALGSGLDAFGVRLAWDPLGNILYIGGSFGTAGGVAASRMAQYTPNGGTWAALGTGTDNVVEGLVVRRDGKVVVCGSFAVAGAISGTVAGLAVTSGGAGSLPNIGRVYYVTALDGLGRETAAGSGVIATSTWTADSLSWTAKSGATKYRLYWQYNGVWGRVTETTATSITITSTSGAQSGLQPPATNQAVGTAATPYIAMWDPVLKAWLTVGSSGFSGRVTDLWMDHDETTLLAAGAFALADGSTANGVAWFNGTLWRGLGPGPAAGSTMYAVRRATDGSVWAAGDAASFGGDSLAKYVGRWIGSLHAGAWTHTDLALPGGIGVYALAENNEDILVGHTANGAATAGGITSVDWPGNLAGYPKLWLTGPGVFWGFGNYEAAADVFAEYTLADGEEVVVDLGIDAKTVVSSRHGHIGYVVRPGSQLGSLCLLPGNSNTVWLLMTATGASADAKLIGYPQYMSVDKAGPA